MSKFKVTILNSASDGKGTNVGVFSTKEKAAEEAWNYARNNCLTCGCDEHDSVIEALLTRDYYMLAYGPRDIEIEELAS